MTAGSAIPRLQTGVQGSAVTTFGYDGTGNQTSEWLQTSRTTYSYDPSNRLKGVVFPDGTRSTYTYRWDVLRRTAHEAGGVLTTFVWDGDDYLMGKTP